MVIPRFLLSRPSFVTDGWPHRIVRQPTTATTRIRELPTLLTRGAGLPSRTRTRTHTCKTDLRERKRERESQCLPACLLACLPRHTCRLPIRLSYTTHTRTQHTQSHTVLYHSHPIFLTSGPTTRSHIPATRFWNQNQASLGQAELPARADYCSTIVVVHSATLSSAAPSALGGFPRWRMEMSPPASGNAG